MKHLSYKETELILVLMRRDQMTEAEARERIAATGKAIREAILSGGLEEPEEILLEELGLEPDYIWNFI